MLNGLLSGERFQSRLLAALILAVLLGLLFTPFLFGGTRSMAVAVRVAVFIVLAASYDLLLGYTGIVSFAHAVFFGMGAYGVAIALKGMGPSWLAVFVGAGAGIAVAVAIAFAVGLLSLRVRDIFFAMITLAVASFFLILASQFSAITGGEDGLTFRVPDLLSPAFRLAESRVLGAALDGRFITYYLILAACLALFLALLRVVNSPFGRVLQAIRENDFRAEALGYRVVIYRSIASCLSAGIAAAAGALMALWLRYTGPAAVLSFDIMIDVLLMLVIGGMGTLYGAVLGAVVLVMAQSYLQDAMQIASQATAAVPLLSAALHPDRWLLWLGVGFVLSVYLFPNGIVGTLRRGWR
jgi:branched-chain amino acid transport system permease protein